MKARPSLAYSSGRMRPVILGTLVLIVIAVSVFAIRFNPADLVASQQKENDELIAEQMAYHVGLLAYVYGYPLVDMAKQQHNETLRIAPDQQVYAPLNRIYRFPEVVGPQNGGNLRLPNNDTLYFSGWFDVRQQPLIIHTPQTDNRYFTIAVTNLYSEVFHISRRTHGTDEAYFALVAPGWEGELPDGVIRIEVETSAGWLLGRLLVDGADDAPAALAVLEGFWSVPLDQFTPGVRPPLPPEIPGEAINPLASMDYFVIMNRTLRELPARPSEAAFMALFDQVGIGPNSEFDLQNIDQPTLRGLSRALIDGIDTIKATESRTTPARNGWMIPKKVGRYGFDYLQRASVVANGYGNLPEESTYAAALTDPEGKLLDGADRYRIHFPAGQLPPVDGFWSVAAYDLMSKQLSENLINRYSIGDRTQGLEYNDDGSLTLWLQHTPPTEKPGNWLPVPEGYFIAIVRMYEPQQAILKGDYLLPRLEKVD